VKNEKDGRVEQQREGGKKKSCLVTVGETDAPDNVC